MSSPEAVQIKVDGANLYREETYTDLKVASFRTLTPVRPDGSPDEGREVIIMGLTHVTSEAGPVPVQCRLDAMTLDGAIQEFPDAAKRTLERMIKEARDLRRQQTSQKETESGSDSKLMLP